MNSGRNAAHVSGSCAQLLRPLRVAGPALHDRHEPSPVRIALHVDHHVGAVTDVVPPSKGFWVSAGAYVVKDGTVSWQPAVDVNRIVVVAVPGRVVVAWVLAGVRAAASSSGRRRR
jgi:hypothetical protein